MTYTQAYPCGVALAIGTITLPLQSPATYQAWSTYSAVVTDSSGICHITYANGGATYNYTVDKARWLPIRLAVSGTIAYTASYGWDAGTDVPVLRTVALKYDTTMAWGGVIFSNTLVNGVMGVREIGVSRLGSPASSASRYGVVVTAAHAAWSPALPVSLSADLLGRARGVGSHPTSTVPGVFVTRLR